jgi:hypothetical protein
MVSSSIQVTRHCAVLANDAAVTQPPHSFARFLDDGRTGLSHNAVKRALRGVALGRKPPIKKPWRRSGKPALIEAGQPPWSSSVIGASRHRRVDGLQRDRALR